MAIYTQGFAHAQDRMWQMEKARRMGSGTLSEMFGKKTLNIDKFSLSLGYRRVSQELWDDPNGLDAYSRELLQAYADGVNDYIEGVGILTEDSTGNLLPPEFYALGIHKNVNAWTPVDSLVMMKILNFHLTGNWNHDLLRDILSKIEED